MKVLITFILCGLALYVYPLKSTAFYFDDKSSIEDNPAVRTINIRNIFNVFNTRFLPGLSFALNYKFNGLHPFAYRLTNLLIHCFNAFLVYVLMALTWYLYQVRNPESICPSTWPAFFGAMLFLCHPVQTEPVNFITQRFVLLGTLFYLASLVLYVKSRCPGEERSGGVYYISSMMTAVAAMFCKEFVVTLPLMIVLYEFFFINASSEGPWQRYRRILPFFVIILIVPVLLLRTACGASVVANIADSRVIEDSHGKKRVIDITRARNAIGRKRYFLTEINVMCTYVRLMFLPVNLNLDYDYPVTSHVDRKTVFCGVFLSCLLAVAWGMYQSYRTIAFGILWFFIALSVESSVIPIGDLITDYRPYLASVGFSFIMAGIIYIRKADIKKLNMIAAVILMTYSIFTFQRNKIWKDEFTLWNDTVQKSPHKARPYGNRGTVYLMQGKFAQAMLDFNNAIKINPAYTEAYNNRGNIYYKQGDFTRALSDYNKAIEINPRFYKAYINRGALFEKEGRFTEALLDLNKAIAINVNSAESYATRGIIDAQEGDLTQAMLDFNKAIEINPDDAGVYSNRGLVYEKQGNWLGGMSDFNRAIALDPKNAEAYNDRGLLDDKQGNYPRAMLDFDKAIEINPRYSQAYYNRGSRCLNQGKFIRALSDYNKAIEINPDYAKAYYFRALIFYQFKKYAMAREDINRAEKLGVAVDPVFISGLKQVLNKVPS